MDSIKDLLDIWKQKRNLLDFEEGVTHYMFWRIRQSLELVFSRLDQAVVQEKTAQGWTIERRTDTRDIQFLFGAVTLNHSLMHDRLGKSHYPLDELLKLKKYKRYSPRVVYEVSKLASQMTCRQVAETLATWTQVRMSHTSVMSCVREVGEAQGHQDQALVVQATQGLLEEGPRHPLYLFAEADGTFIRGLRKRQGIEVKHLILYEGWQQNGERRSLQAAFTILTTRGVADFWAQAAAVVQQRYTLNQTQIVANSDGGAGYGEDRFQEALDGSQLPIKVQLDAFHVSQALTRSLHGDKRTCSRIQSAIQRKDRDRVTALMDTYESNLKDEKEIAQMEQTKQYVLGHWDRLFDWRESVAPEKLPANAGKLGAMESNQRLVTFRMKKRGMHWGASQEGMVKVIQGLRNETLKNAFLASFQPSSRDQRTLKKALRIASLLSQKTRPSIGVQHGRMGSYVSSSSAVGAIKRSVNYGG